MNFNEWFKKETDGMSLKKDCKEMIRLIAHMAWINGEKAAIKSFIEDIEKKEK